MKKILMAICLSLSLAGCSINSIYGEVDPELSSVEMQALQTREFEATEDQVFSAIIATFQDCGYIVSSADRSTGLVLGKTTSATKMYFDFNTVEYDKASAFVEKVAEGRVKVRVSIVRYMLMSYATGRKGEKESVRTKPEYYQKIFDKITQSLFLKKNL